MMDTKKSEGASAISESVAPGTSASRAIRGEPAKSSTVVTTPIAKSSRNAVLNTAVAPFLSPTATFSETILEMAVGKPADEMTSSHE